MRSERGRREGEGQSENEGEGLTQADEEEEDEEHVEDGQHRHGERRDDLPEGPDPPEEADDAERPQRPHDARRLARGGGGGHAHDDDKGVEDAPRVGDEGAEPVAEGVDGELDREEDREGHVQPLHRNRQRGSGPVRAPASGWIGAVGGRAGSPGVGHHVGLRAAAAGVAVHGAAVGRAGVEVLRLDDGADEALQGTRTSAPHRLRRELTALAGGRAGGRSLAPVVSGRRASSQMLALAGAFGAARRTAAIRTAMRP
jgi:hypothetical protein